MWSPICNASEYVEELQRCIGDASEKCGVRYAGLYSDTTCHLLSFFDVNIATCAKLSHWVFGGGQLLTFSKGHLPPFLSGFDNTMYSQWSFCWSHTTIKLAIIGHPHYNSRLSIQLDILGAQLFVTQEPSQTYSSTHVTYINLDFGD